MGDSEKKAQRVFIPPKHWDEKYIEEINIFNETVEDICASDKTTDIKESEQGEHFTASEKDKMAVENYNLVYGILKTFQSSSLDPSEIESLALVGFSRALNSYKKNSVTKFTTYCFVCMKNEVLTYIKNTSGDKDISSYDKENVSPEGDTSLMKEILKDDSPGVEEISEVQYIVSIIRESIEYALSDKEAFIIKSRYCIDGYDYLNQMQLARMYQVSQASISKLEKCILAKLRIHLIAKYKMRGVN